DGRVEDGSSDRGTGNAGGGEPAWPLSSLVRAQERFFGEVCGRGDALGNSRRANCRHRRRKKVNGVGVAPGAIAIANGEVEALAGEIHAIVVGLNAQVHEWMRLAEGRQSRQEPAGCEGADDTGADNAAEVTLCEPPRRCAQADERIRDCRNESLSLVGQCQPAWQAAEQLNAQTRLQALDLMADGGLTDTQLHARF